MTDEHLDSLDEPSADELAALDRLLAHDAVWHEPAPGGEDALLAAIAAESGHDVSTHDEPAAPPAPSMLDERRAMRAGGAQTMPWWLAAAAVVAVVVAGVALVTRGDDDGSGGGGVQIAMAGTAAAPAASAVVDIAATPAGLKILLDADGLEPAPPNSFYEAWVSDGTTRVSAGTFHLRGGSGPIELWAGVVGDGFEQLSVTLEPLDGDTDSSGDVRLRGTFELPDG